ncbi:hypothetical protein KI387_040419, partial [Taxus chinensis]
MHDYSCFWDSTIDAEGKQNVVAEACLRMPPTPLEDEDLQKKEEAEVGAAN